MAGVSDNTSSAGSEQHIVVGGRSWRGLAAEQHGAVQRC